MGQRELLLMLLASIITALAIWVGIRVFNNQALDFDEQEYNQIMLEVAELAQAWYIKPKELGGGGYSYSGMDWDQIPCPLDEINSGGKNCFDESNDHQIFINGVEDHNFRINTLLKFRNKRYIGEVDVKADTGIIVLDWREF